MRAVLAATLSSVYGIYSGFELCENEPIAGKEEYLDSEKYEIKQRDWDVDSPNNIAAIIGRLNQIRRERPALQRYNDVRFFEVDNPNVIGYYKMTEDRSDIVACVVNLDPFHAQESLVHLPLAEFGLKADELFQAHDLLHDERYLWRGPTNYVRLEPDGKMAHVFKIRRWQHYEAGFDYFV
jgi:starch synthase (maltosyl-transferring)